MVLIEDWKARDPVIDFAFDVGIAGVIQIAIALLELHLHKALGEMVDRRHEIGFAQGGGGHDALDAWCIATRGGGGQFHTGAVGEQVREAEAGPAAGVVQFFENADGVGQYAAYLIDSQFSPGPEHRHGHSTPWARAPPTGHESASPAHSPPHPGWAEIDPTLIGFCQDTSPSWFEAVALFIFAGEGGAAVMFYAAVRGYLPQWPA